VGNRLIEVTREPVVQFLLIGACIYGLYAGYGTPPDDAAADTIIVDEARIEAFAAQWTKRWNRQPTGQELDGVIDAFVREDILYRQAVAMGLDQDDPITRRRMAQKLEFLTSDIALYKQPSADDLAEYFEKHETRYRDEDLISFRHVFFDPDLRDDSIFEDVGAGLSQLQAADDPDTAAAGVGDRFLSQSAFQQATALEIRRQLGSGFTEALMKLEPGIWQGPVLSGYGMHLVYIHALRHAPPARFEDVEERVLEDWQTEQQDRFNEEFYQSLKSRYEIDIADRPPGLVLDVPGQEPAEGAAATPVTPEDVPAS
jgi:peptidyl-prolyl cis-trans isomerase C